MGEIAFSTDVAEAASAAGPFLRRDSAANNVALMLLDRQTNRPESVARFWWCGEGDELAGVCFQVGEARGVHVNINSDGEDSDLAARFAVEVASAFPETSGVDGLVSEASAFAASWATHRHVPVTTGMFQRYYILSELIPGPPGPGRVRLATTDDFGIVMPWAIAFQREAIEKGDSQTTVDVDGLSSVIRWKLEAGEIWVWDDGGPQCMVGATGLVESVSRIHLVYTPPENRGRGLGASCTAGTVAEVMKAGASHCVLFTDLANPTSNAIYQRLGFEPAGEYLHLDFG